MNVETFLKWKILPRFMMLASTICPGDVPNGLWI